MTAVIVVHGGAGFHRQDLRRGLAGVIFAAKAGSDCLKKGRTALDAVESAVVTMEDNEIFNAGRGSALTYRGTVEMDAAIMDGKTLSAGAVALVHNVKNPVRLARLVMERTDHVLIAGESAEQLAKVFSLPKCNPITARRRRMYMKLKKETKNLPTKNSLLLRDRPGILTDTVGAVALDLHGNFAAAASTGGITLKFPGRIGDTPQIGSGLYTDNTSGASTATGLGEVAIKLALSKAICTMMEQGMSAPEASLRAIKSATRRLNGQAGVISIDKRGRTAAVHNSKFMPWAYCTVKMQSAKGYVKGTTVSSKS
ncbi:MAG TPA: isoaspartyl peptidase/L-asparaginase [Methylomirabilota bacterium]|nr:isoaspartyl peptidase/L-asparaginase [Methylomirabilota bacterium]